MLVDLISGLGEQKSQQGEGGPSQCWNVEAKLTKTLDKPGKYSQKNGEDYQIGRTPDAPPDHQQ
jgi:hypothetical protein